MTDRLMLEPGVLRSAGTDLRAIAQEFVEADARTHALAEQVGHEELADAVRDFSRGWDDRRARIVEDVAALADACTGIGDGFEDLDGQLAAALRGEE
ncbi:hypothetical protein [Cellulomonas sp. HZM]|uniref:hypothetical protein n=1 Tax=Cellulomonas sp. HZM TaxID=1454010 RepID=UPI0012DE865E|nr:hypothetical protein [Cellulomonas sp. HZM]